MSARLTRIFQYIDMTGGPEACWPWKRKVRESDGRPYITIGLRRYLAYRLVYELSFGEKIPQGQVIRHICDNPSCCNPRHLLTGTQQENMNDMKARERHGLPHHVVRRIRALRKQGRTQQEVADLYGISREVVSKIDTKRLYEHVEDEK